MVMPINENYTIYRNFEAEQSVIGSALQDSKAAELVAEMKADDFSYPAHRTIQQAVQKLVREHSMIDLVTMNQALIESKQIAQIGGPEYLMKVINVTPTVANVRSYIGIVRECASRRQLQAIGQALIDGSADGMRTVDEIREKAALTIRNVITGNSSLLPLSDSIMSTIEGLQDKNAISRVVPLGISDIDNRIGGGLCGSVLMVIGARPSVGKSILALTFCLNAAKHGKRVLLSTLEMRPTEIDKRILSNVAFVPMSEIISNDISCDSWIMLTDSVPTIAKWPITYTTDATTLENLRRDAFQMYENDGLDLICVDYMQLMHGNRHYPNRQEEVAEISRGLKQLAMELDVPIIALSQLSRPERIGCKRIAPSMSDARESGAIEQDADIFLILHDPQLEELNSDSEKRLYYNLVNSGKKPILVKVDKGRMFKSGCFWLAFDGEHMQFLPLKRD